MHMCSCTEHLVKRRPLQCMSYHLQYTNEFPKQCVLPYQGEGSRAGPCSWADAQYLPKRHERL